MQRVTQALDGYQARSGRDALTRTVHRALLNDMRRWFAVEWGSLGCEAFDKQPARTP